MSDIDDWARRAAITLDGARPDLSALDDRIAGCEAIFLGELNHFIHEKSAFRLAFAPYLLSRNWRAFAEELGWSDGLRVQDYLDTGEASRLERLVTFGHDAHRRADRPDRMGGILKPSAAAYPTQVFKAEHSRFYAGLRAAAQGQGVAVSLRGIDIDALPGGAYEDLAAWLTPAELADLARVPGETAPQEAARLRRAAARFRDRPEAIALLAALADSLDYVARTYEAADMDALRPGMAFREDCMKRRAADAFALRPAGTPGLVVMAHAFHLAKDDRLFVQGIGGVGPGGGVVPSLGHHLVQERGLRAYSVWMVYGEGEDSQPFPNLPRKASYPADSLNRRLALFDRPVLLPLHDAPAALTDQPIGVGHMYNAVVPTRLKGQMDAIYFLPRATPLQG